MSFIFTGTEPSEVKFDENSVITNLSEILFKNSPSATPVSVWSSDINFIASGDYVWKSPKGTGSWSKANFAKSSYINCYFKDAWFVGSTQGLKYSFDGKIWNNILSSSVSCLFLYKTITGADNMLFVGTSDGLYVITKTASSFTTEKIFETTDNSIVSVSVSNDKDINIIIFIDSSGNVYSGTFIFEGGFERKISGSSSLHLTGVKYGNGRFLLFSNDLVTPLYYTDGGETFINTNTNKNARVRDALYAEGKWFLACGTYYSGLQFSVDNGVSWQSFADIPMISVFSSITYANGVFIACGIGNKCVRSEDGVNWTEILNNSSFSGAYYKNGVWFVCKGASTSALYRNIYYSTDNGINWNTVQLGDDTGYLNGMSFKP